MDNYLDNYHNDDNIWRVKYTNSALKGVGSLSKDILKIVYELIREIKMSGPYRFNWRNYSKLKGFKNKFHCHLNKGRPTYVVCWELADKETRLIEVYYVGTHEKAPY